MFKRPGGSGTGLPTSSNGSHGVGNGASNGTGNVAAASSSSAPPPRNPKRSRRPGPIGTPLYGHSYDSSMSSSSGGDFRPATATCTNFLLGGQYYPGKGKSRSQSSQQFLLRRRSLAYRIFCSSPPRMCGTTVLVIYLAFVFVLMPILGLLMDLGRSLAGGGGSGSGTGHIRATVINKKGPTNAKDGIIPPAPDLDGRNFPSLAGLKLRPVQEIKGEAMKLHEDIKRKRQTTGDKVGNALSDTLEDLVPEWLHRNDPPEAAAADDKGKKDNAGGKHKGDVAAGTGAVMEDDEEGRAAADGDQDGGDNADTAIDEHDANDFDGNPEEGIDAVDIDDDIDEARGDDTVQEPPPEDKNAAKPKDVGTDAKKSPVKKEQKTTRDEALPLAANESRPLRTLQSMDALPPSSSCPADLAPDKLSTTLVTQCTLNRVDLLLETCNRWKGPIILSLFLADDEEESAWSGRESNWEEMCPQMTVLVHRATAGEEKAGSYPVNKLRNIGLDTVKTSHVFVMDADFVPSADLHSTIGDVLSARHQMEQMEGMHEGTSGERDAIIVPAFERKPPKPCSTIEDCRKYIKEDDTFIPQNIEDLRNCSQGSKKDCIVFQSDNNWEGHHTTHSEQWLKGDWYDDGDYRELEEASDGANAEMNKRKKKRRRENIDLSRKIKTVKCFDSLRYEPWVVLRWCPSSKADDGNQKRNDIIRRPVAPYFDERFHGYGKNKIEMISHLRFLGYTFSILPMSFIIHQPHPESQHKEVWKDVENEDLHYDMDEMYPKFLRELARMYDGGKDAVPTCKKQKNQKQKKPAEEMKKTVNNKPQTEKQKDGQRAKDKPSEEKTIKIKRKPKHIDLEKEEN